MSKLTQPQPTHTGATSPGVVTILEFELPKISLNEWYAGTHWTKRTKIKDTYRLLIAAKTHQTFTAPCHVEYRFTFRSRPLDCSNAVAMVKMIEDCIFPDDSYKVVRSIKISSDKGKQDGVTVVVRNE
jgi:hypothetical protein